MKISYHRCSLWLRRISLRASFVGTLSLSNGLLLGSKNHTLALSTVSLGSSHAVRPGLFGRRYPVGCCSSRLSCWDNLLGRVGGPCYRAGLWRDEAGSSFVDRWVGSVDEELVGTGLLCLARSCCTAFLRTIAALASVH